MSLQNCSYLDRRLSYERTCRKSEAVYREHPLDAANLISWGEALLMLAQYDKYLNDRVTLVQDAISYLESALVISPSSHKTVWLLGGAYTTFAFLNVDDKDANFYFEKASECYQKAVDSDPKNDNYTRSLEICPQAPFERAKHLGWIINRGATVGGHVKVPEQQAEIQSDMGSNQHIPIGHVKVPEQQAEIQSDMGSNQHISIGHVKVPERQAAEIQSDMGSNQHISIGHVKVMLENMGVSDMIQLDGQFS